MLEKGCHIVVNYPQGGFSWDVQRRAIQSRPNTIDRSLGFVDIDEIYVLYANKGKLYVLVACDWLPL